MNRIAWRLIAALTFGAAGPGSAPGALAGAQVIGPSTAQFSVEIGKGRLIRLDSPAASVFVADPKIADIQVKSPSLVYVIGKAAGETTLFAVDEHDRVLANIGVDVHFDEGQIRQDIKHLLPNSDIAVSTANDTLVLSGTVGSAAEGENVRTIAARFAGDKDHIVNALQVDAPNQINLRVRVAEVSRDIIKQFGFNWGSGGVGPGHFAFGTTTGTGTYQSSLTNGVTTNVTTSIYDKVFNQAPAVNATTATGVSGLDNIFASFATHNLDLNLVVDALDSEGLVTVLAEPNLTAISGAQASFLAGGEFPIPVPQGLNVTTIDYKKFGVSLSFIATIVDNGRINLVVKPEVSELSSDGAISLNGITVPALTTRRTETTVDLASGQSFAIAGLLQNNVTQNIQKFPGLGNVPVLGALFRSDEFQRNETELVIIVTPYIVRPVSNKRLALPTDGYIAPTDMARLATGDDYTPQPIGQPSSVAAPRGRGLIGPVGFDLQ